MKTMKVHALITNEVIWPTQFTPPISSLLILSFYNWVSFIYVIYADCALIGVLSLGLLFVSSGTTNVRILLCV